MNYNTDSNIEQLYQRISRRSMPREARKIFPHSDLVLGFGTRRLVVQHPENEKRVIKFSLSKEPQHNKNEVQIYKKAKSENIDNLLTTIYTVDSSYRWIITERVPCPISSDKRYSGPKAVQIKDQIKETLGFELYEIETTETNTGEVVAFDYGQLK